MRHVSVILVPIWVLIKNFQQCHLFFAKIEKTAYTRNGTDTLNIHIGIISFLHKISTQFFSVW